MIQSVLSFRYTVPYKHRGRGGSTATWGNTAIPIIISTSTFIHRCFIFLHPVWRGEAIAAEFLDVFTDFQKLSTFIENHTQCCKSVGFVAMLYILEVYRIEKCRFYGYVDVLHSLLTGIMQPMDFIYLIIRDLKKIVVRVTPPHSGGVPPSLP